MSTVTATPGLRASGTPRATGRVRAWLGQRVLPVLTGIGALLVWQLVSQADTSFLPRSSVPAPTDVARALADLVGASILWSAIGQTLQAWAVGLVIACALGIPLGIVIGSSRWLFVSLRGLIEVLRPIPSVTLLPLLVLTIGLGLELKVFIIASGTFWVILIQALYGVREVDPVARDMTQAYGITGLRRFVRLILPSAAPYLTTGFRLGAVIALNICVGVELIVGSAGGLGVEIATAQQTVRVPQMYAYVVVAATIGLLMNLVLRRLERRVMHWHPSHRDLVH